MIPRGNRLLAIQNSSKDSIKQLNQINGMTWAISTPINIFFIDNFFLSDLITILETSF